MHEVSKTPQPASGFEPHAQDEMPSEEVANNSPLYSTVSSTDIPAQLVTKDNIIALQRTIGNRAVQRLLSQQRVQRTTSDNANHVCNAGCNHVARLVKPVAETDQAPAEGTEAFPAYSSENADNTEAVPVQRTLSTTVQRDDADDRLLAYNTLQDDLAEYTSRTAGKAKRDFTDENLDEASRAYALSLPRDAEGQLTQEAIEILNAKEQSDAKVTLLDKYATFGVTDNRTGWFKDYRLKNAMNSAANLNTVTGKTRLPDLANILSPNGRSDAVVTADMDVGGVTMSVTYNTSDVNFAKRLGLLATGVQKVTAKGFVVPKLNVQVPKYSRSLTLNSDCSITVGLTTSAAQYVAPNLMHLGSSGIDNPQEDTREKPGTTTGERELRFTSTQVDPTGVGTVVHELGHALHYALSPGKFHELSMTTFKGKGSTVANKVSGYATNAREFVAEVFLGLVYDRVYSADVLAMYEAFGGPEFE